MRQTQRRNATKPAIPGGALALLIHLVSCEQKGRKPTLRKRGRAIRALRDRGLILKAEVVPSDAGRKALARLGVGA